jgi:hypothetical protein
MKKIIGRFMKKEETIEGCKKFLVTGWTSMVSPRFANFEFIGTLAELEEFLVELTGRMFKECNHSLEDSSIDRGPDYYQLSSVGRDIMFVEMKTRNEIKFYAVPISGVPIWTPEILKKKAKRKEKGNGKEAEEKH